MSAVIQFQQRSEPARRTVANVFDWFLAHDSKLTNSDARKERVRVLGLFRLFRNSDGRLMESSFCEDCIGADLVEFLDAHPNLSQWSRRRWCSTVRRPFQEAVKLGLISFSPFQGITERKGENGRDLTDAEFRGLLHYATACMRRVLLFLRWSGARPEELRTLEWPHIEWGNRQIVKRKHKTAAKTGRPRVIPLSDRLLTLLKWIRDHHPHGGRWVFVNSFGGQWTRRALCKNIAAYRAKAGLAADVKLYGTRHAFITGAILNGLDVATVAEIVGHSNIQTTQNYLHLTGKSAHLQAAMEKAARPPIQTPAESADEVDVLLTRLRELLTKGTGPVG